MKKHSMRILGLLLFICVAFVQDSFSQDFKPMSEAQSAVQDELDAISNATSNVIRLDDTGVSSVRQNTVRYYYAYLDKLSNASNTEDAFTAVNSEWENLNYAANWSTVVGELSNNLLSLISEN